MSGAPGLQTPKFALPADAVGHPQRQIYQGETAAADACICLEAMIDPADCQQENQTARNTSAPN